MPELPEAEVTRRGLAPAAEGRILAAAVIRVPKLRKSLPDLAQALSGMKLLLIERRAKYLIWRFAGEDGCERWMSSHMGMSGSWRIWPYPAPAPGKHDHVDLIFRSVGSDAPETVLRYTDPRRFGSIEVFDEDPRRLPPLSLLGPEPWDPALDARSFRESLLRTARPIKEVLLSGKCVVGCGNIYCSEALFLAGIRPSVPASSLSLTRAGRLLLAVRTVLENAIAAGGSTLRDFHGAQGQDGWFALSAAVYGREGEPCPKCGAPIRRTVMGGRSAFWCPHCQR